MSDQARESHAFACWFDAVRAILMRDWDPLGINRFPLAIDEYDEYARAIVRLLWSPRPTEGALSEYLEMTERGLNLAGGDGAKRRTVARALLALDRSEGPHPSTSSG